MICGYPHFRKPPHIYIYTYSLIDRMPKSYELTYMLARSINTDGNPRLIRRPSFELHASKIYEYSWKSKTNNQMSILETDCLFSVQEKQNIYGQLLRQEISIGVPTAPSLTHLIHII